MSSYTRNRGRKPRIDQSDVVDAALDIIDRKGLDALSMRRLGKRLEVDPMTIYHHVGSKSELLDLTIDSVMESIDLSVDDPALTWQERTKILAYGYRDVLRAHPNLLPAIADGRARMFGGLDTAESLLSIFEAAGLSRSRWIIAMHAFSTWVLGELIMERTFGQGAEHLIVDWAASVSPGEYPSVSKAIASHRPMDPDASFRYGIATLIAGLQALAKADLANGSVEPKG